MPTTDDAVAKASSRFTSTSSASASRSRSDSSSTTPSADEPPSQDFEEWTTLEEGRTMSILAPFWTLLLVGGMTSMALAL